MRTDPVIIGGTGGSGTTVFVWMLRKLGLDIGDLGPSGSEWKPFSKFVTSQGIRLLTQPEEWGRSRIRLEEVLEEHQGRHGDGPWGMKAPQSCIALPFLAHCLPEMRFIHVVRDGREMALSKNQNQPNRYADLFLSPDDLRQKPAVRSARSWSAINCWVLKQGCRLLGDRFSILRFEDLVVQPRETLQTAEWAGLHTDHLDEAVALLEPKKPGLGRWLELPDDEQEAITEAAEAGLRAFGYL